MGRAYHCHGRLLRFLKDLIKFVLKLTKSGVEAGFDVASHEKEGEVRLLTYFYQITVGIFQLSRRKCQNKVYFDSLVHTLNCLIC